MDTTSLPFQYETTDRCSIICLTPHLAEVNWGDLEQVGTEIIQRVQQKPEPNVLVDLSQLSYMGSSQVALVVRLWKAIKSRNGKMAVQVTHPLVRDVLRIAGLNSLWDITETRVDALRSLGIGPTRRSTIMPIVGVVGLVVAIAGLCIALLNPSLLPPQTLQILRYVAAGVTLFAGVWTVARARRSTRVLGGGMIGAAALLITFQILEQIRVLR